MKSKNMMIRNARFTYTQYYVFGTSYATTRNKLNCLIVTEVRHVDLVYLIKVATRGTQAALLRWPRTCGSSKNDNLYRAVVQVTTVTLLPLSEREKW